MGVLRYSITEWRIHYFLVGISEYMVMDMNFWVGRKIILLVYTPSVVFGCNGVVTMYSVRSSV